MPTKILVPHAVYAAQSIRGAPYGESDLLLAPWSAWRVAPPSVDSALIGLQAPKNLGEIPEVLVAMWKGFWTEPNAHPLAPSIPPSFVLEGLLPENARELWDRFALLTEGWLSEASEPGTRTHPSLFSGRPCLVDYARQVLWDAMMEKLLADPNALNAMGSERFEALLSHLDTSLCMDRSVSGRFSDARWFSSVFVLKDQLSEAWRPCLDRLARHFAASNTTSLMYDGCFIQWWKQAIQSPTGLDSWSVLDPEVDQKAIYRQWHSAHVTWSHGSFLATKAPLDQLGGWIDALRDWDLHVDPAYRVGRSLAASALERLLLEQPSQQQQITPDRFLRLRSIAKHMASWSKTDRDPSARYETPSLAHRVCIIFSDPLPPQAQTVYEHADRDLIDILTQDIDWTDDGVVAAPPSPRFPMGSAPVSLLMENVCTLASRLMRSSPDDDSLSVKMLRAVIALPLLDGHRHKLVSTILSSDRGLQPLPGQVEFRYMLLDDVLSAASRSECSELLEDARLADARPHHPAVERAILSRAAGVGEIETPSTRRRLV